MPLHILIVQVKVQLNYNIFLGNSKKKYKPNLKTKFPADPFVNFVSIIHMSTITVIGFYQ